MSSETVPQNLTAQFTYRARGNPPSTLPDSAVANCFPGLEFDLRNLWRKLIDGIELHEAGAGGEHWVVGVTPGSAAEGTVAPFDHLISLDGVSVLQQIAPNATHSLEFSNAFASVVGKAASGQPVRCRFERRDSGQTSTFEIDLLLVPPFESGTINPALADPGEMTQSLCSPWQADYRECGCFYWAASRPDYVNVDESEGVATGHSWMQTDRSPGADYVPDTLGDGPGEVQYRDLYRRWEQVLRFVIGGRDAT